MRSVALVAAFIALLMVAVLLRQVAQAPAAPESETRAPQAAAP
jgi:hypothetical protein